MKVQRISITQAKQNLGEVVKRVAYGGERFVLEFRGKPRAALVSWDDLKRLQELPGPRDETELLDELRRLRENISARTGTLPSSSETLEEIRKGRSDELAGLR